MKRLAKKDRRAFAAIRTTLLMLQDDAFDARLASHKLKGDLAGLWACSAGYDLLHNPAMPWTEPAGTLLVNREPARRRLGH